MQPCAPAQATSFHSFFFNLTIIRRMFTEPEANNCFSIIFRDEYQEPQNNGVKHKNTDAIVRVHTRMQLEF